MRSVECLLCVRHPANKHIRSTEAHTFLPGPSEQSHEQP